MILGKNIPELKQGQDVKKKKICKAYETVTGEGAPDGAQSLSEL